MPIFKLSVTLFLLGSLIAAASLYAVRSLPGPLVAENPACGCPSSGPDPFDRGLAYNFGPLRGRCINSCEFRSPELARRGAHYQMANVYDGQSFWTAKVKLTKIEGVEVLFQNFASEINHVALLFRFTEPVELREQAPIPGRAPKRKFVKALVISPEGVPAVGESYNLVDGMLGRYTFVFRALSLEYFVANSEKLGFKVQSFPGKFGSLESARLFDLAAQTAQAQSFRTVYQLLFNNCATNTLDLALAAKNPLGAPGRDFRNLIDPLRGVPLMQRIGTRRTLESRQLVEPQERWLVKAQNPQKPSDAPGWWAAVK